MQDRLCTLKRMCWICALASLITVLLLVSAALAMDMPVPSAFCHMGRVTENNVNVYSGPSSRSETIRQLNPNDKVVVTGVNGDFYRISLEDKEVYVFSNKLRLTAEVCEDILPEDIDGQSHLETTIPILGSQSLPLTGVLKTEKPVDTVFAYLWDERLYSIEQAYLREIPNPTTKLDLSAFSSWLSLSDVQGGRKTLVLQAASGNEVYVVYRSPVYIRGKNAEPLNVTSLCDIKSEQVLDTQVTTAWKPTKSSPALVIDIPEKAHAKLLTIDWLNVPDEFTIESFGQGEELLSSETKSTGFYADWAALSNEVRRVLISAEGKDCGISNVRVYADPYPSHVVQQWESIPEKIDLLFIATHQDDELLFFGGGIPYYSHRNDVTAAVLYTSTCSRLRVKEALDGLWTSGMKYHPIFLGMPDKYTLNIKEAGGMWKKLGVQQMIVEALRRYKPEVIVCQDFNGEYGHGQHKLTVQLAADAVALANDPQYDPESAEKWGIWEVKKMYSHLYPENVIHMDWTQPLDESGVITPIFLANEAYDKHRSQVASFNMRRDGKKYDNTAFGLYYTTVGPDMIKNDFMENIILTGD